jgi:Flp pilus assembly protein TadG
MQILRSQKGAVAVLVALAATCLIGMAALVVDVGLLYVNREQLVNLADAAALAGAQDLPVGTDTATATAEAYGAKNGKPGDNVGVSTTSRSITVTASRNVTYFLAQIMGLTGKNVTATATATLTPVGAASGVAPLAIVQQDFVYDQTYTLKQGAGDGTGGNYGGLSLGGNGANVYYANLLDGYDGVLRIGQTNVYTETGNIVGKTDSAVTQRIQSGNPIIVIPVIKELPTDGKKPIEIVGFAAFYLESADSGVVTGKFVKTFLGNDFDETGPDYGLYNISLTQ